MAAAPTGVLRQYVGANLRRLRERAGLTQEQLANEVETPTRYVVEIEAGKANLTLDMLERLALVVAVEPSEMLWKAQLVKRGRGRPKQRVGPSRRSGSPR